MKRTVHEMKCDDCKAEEKVEGDPYLQGWRTLTVRFQGDPYPVFEGDTCPRCTEKHKAIFERTRPSAEAAALLANAAELVRGGK